MNLIKTREGYFLPAYPSDWESSKRIKVGTEVYAIQARNPQFHRKYFALLKIGFENQDTYNDLEIYRQVIVIKAGYVHWVEGKDGHSYPLPQSISFEKMKQENFEKLYAATLEIISKEIDTSKINIESEIAGFY